MKPTTAAAALLALLLSSAISQTTAQIAPDAGSLMNSIERDLQKREEYRAIQKPSFGLRHPLPSKKGIARTRKKKNSR
jgi:hypothetical protein